MTMPLIRLGRASLWGSLALIAASGATQAAQPTYTPPYVQLPNILYVVPYAVSTQPVVSDVPAFPDGETVITIGGAKRCKVQVEWVDWNGVVAGYSGAPVPPNPAVPGNGALEYVTPAKSPVALSPFILNVFSDVKEPFEGHANIRSDCQAGTKPRIDAEFVVIPNANAAPQYKEIPVVQPAGSLGN
jgi:hypothetical protein